MYDWNLPKKNMLLIGNRLTDVKCAENFNIQGFLYNTNDNLLDFFKEKIL